VPRKIPPLLGLALWNLLLTHGWTGEELAAATKVSKSTVSGYLTGDINLNRERLEWLAAQMGIGPVQVERAVNAARLVNAETPAPGSPVDPTDDEWRIIEGAVAFGLGEIADLLRARGLRAVREEHVRRERAEAEALVRHLRSLSRARRRVLVEGAPEYQTWAVCVRLCDESEKKAAHCARQALEWAALACRAAPHVPGGEAFRSRLLGFAQPFVANALRVKGRLKKAEKIFVKARQHWEQGTDEAGLLDEGRVFDLEASLCRAQRRFDEALKLHRQALEAADPDQIGIILLNMASTLEVKGDYQASIKVLEQAAPLIDGRRQPRLFCVLRFNWAGTLCRMGRAKEAVPIVRDVRAMAERLRNDLDLTRTLWLESQVLEGLGRREEAVAALEQVKGDFAARTMPYDFGLASLDLALLYREQDRWAEVQTLAAEMARIFKAAGVHREAVAAALLFHEAAERHEVTVGLVKQLQEYLMKARTNAKLRFKACEA
jgi:tetratricopeptide (TPR) repeat protein